ncbi:MAG TPA: macro domain-containing protein [Gemmatimonadales bacterium]|nr:macro domain-containing protein [Gemmatimonadales bacterium]
MIRVVVADLARCPADAVVRPTTSRFDAPTPNLASLDRAGGPGFRASLRVADGLGLGAAVVTAGGGDLPAEFVIHAVIREDPGQAPTPDLVARAWRAALQQAAEWQFAHIAAPPIGADGGTGALPLADVAEILVAVVGHHRARSAFPSEVSFVVDSADERDLFEAAVRRVAARDS